MKKQCIILSIFFILFSSDLFSENPKIELVEEKQKTEKPKDEKKDEKKDDKKSIFEVSKDDNKFTLSIKNRTEAFYGRSTRLLSGSPLDQVVYPQTTIELTAYAESQNAVKAQVVFRNKSRWGNPNSIAQTTESPIKLGDAEVGSHKHFIGRQIVWIKECWAEILLNKAFSLETKKEHTWKLGVFPFELGRGIALGSAYAVSPGLIGFFNTNIIDQFAPGSLFHGTLHEGRAKLYYDFYIGILENKSDSFDVVNARIYSQEIGRRKNPYRGFGKIDYIVAGKLDWIIESICEGDKLIIQPYGLYNNEPEQKVEFIADASSKLGTVGLYTDYVNPTFEWGCDFALNYGAQKVKAWDRNDIKVENRNGNLVFVYSHVTEGQTKTKALVTPENKEIVNKSEQSPLLNGKEIDSSGLFNEKNRFRSAYENKYRGGFMFVTDATYKFTPKFQIASTFGFSTGDENPNKNLRSPLDSEVDGDFQGFIGLQEVYSGKRVKSSFLIGANKLVRPLSVPDQEIAPIERFASDTPGFSNLIFFGGGLTYKPVSSTGKQININPNILSYWLEHPTRKFDCNLKRSTTEFASSYLGTELNLWFDAKLLKSLKAFIITGIFIPGQHYKDIKGKPLNAEQIKIINEPNDTGFNAIKPPLLGDHFAYVLNFGFEYNF